MMNKMTLQFKFSFQDFIRNWLQTITTKFQWYTNDGLRYGKREMWNAMSTVYYVLMGMAVQFHAYALVKVLYAYPYSNELKWNDSISLAINSDDVAFVESQRFQLYQRRWFFSLDYSWSHKNGVLIKQWLWFSVGMDAIMWFDRDRNFYSHLLISYWPIGLLLNFHLEFIVCIDSFRSWLKARLSMLVKKEKNLLISVSGCRFNRWLNM